RIEHHHLEDSRSTKELTRGQQLLILLGAFDSQVSNGGVTQFFLDCPGSLFEVADAIEELGAAELVGQYGKALEALVGKKDRWLELRAEWAGAKDNPRWETFQQTYDLLDLGWFDRAYFGQWGHNEKQEWVQFDRGLKQDFLKQLAEYVKAHR